MLQEGPRPVCWGLSWGRFSGSPSTAGRGGYDGGWPRGSEVQGLRSTCPNSRVRGAGQSADGFGGVLRTTWSLGLAPGSCPGLSSGPGHSQSRFVPWEPLGCLARLVLLVHSLAVIPTEDIFRGRQGARLAGRTWTAPLSRELGEGALTSLQCDPWGCLPRAVASLPGKF